MTEKQTKINALVKALHDGKIDDDFLHSQVRIISQSTNYDKNHPHFFESSKKDNTKGYSAVMRRNWKRS